jgi:hypothetical protein
MERSATSASFVIRWCALPTPALVSLLGVRALSEDELL